MHTSGPRLIIIRGLPGSGKSSLAAALKDKIGAEQVVILDPDAIDYDSAAYQKHCAALQAEGVEPKFYPYRFLRAQAHAAIAAHKTIIWNQAFTLLGGLVRTIANLTETAATQGSTLQVLIVEITIREAVARQRVSGRASKGGHDVNDETFSRFIKDYRSFADEGYPTVIVNGEAPLAASVASVMRALGA